MIPASNERRGVVDKASAIGMGFCPLLEVREASGLTPLASRLFWRYKIIMSIDSAIKPKKGRPKVDSEAVNVRFERAVLDEVDAWIAANGPPYVTRPEAIRRLVQVGLKDKSP